MGSLWRGRDTLSSYRQKYSAERQGIRQEIRRPLRMHPPLCAQTNCDLLAFASRCTQNQQPPPLQQGVSKSMMIEIPLMTHMQVAN